MHHLKSGTDRAYVKVLCCRKPFCVLLPNFILPELALNWMARQLMAGVLQQHRAQGRTKAIKSNHLFTQILQPFLVSLLHMQQVTSLREGSSVLVRVPVTVMHMHQ